MTPPSPPQIYQKNHLYVWNNSHMISSEHCQRTPEVQKRANQSPLNEVGQKIKTRGDKGFQNGDPCPSEGSHKVGEFLNNKKPPHRWDQQGTLDPQRKARGKAEKMHYRNCAKQQFQLRNGSHICIHLQ